MRPLASKVAYEQKFDGYRALVFTRAGPGGRVLLQTRRGALVQGAFADLVASAEAQLPAGLVLDGELLVWDVEAGVLSFEGLQRRAAARTRSASALAAKLPALFVVFDVLQFDGRELLDLPYVERRARLEALFADHALTSPWTLCPMTTDAAKAREWLESWTDVSGVEGIVVKPQSRYMPGHRGAWTKVRRRDTTEAITGAITGTLTRPQLLVLGRHDPDGRLRAVGRTVPLRTEAAHLVAEHLTVADSGRPWEGVTFAATWGSRDVLDVRLVRPDLVAEISADRSIDRGGVWRHPLRFKRLRLDVTVDDVPLLGAGPAAAAG
ncbi:RNA ligase family protein [Streptomyces sp. A1136]|uniref:ATP-dependent DNA ligase n=1 Tax=Streptomyces sp. A1136 TaxID=2563102 RepID=UPI001F0FF250|nr:RNA ligase family protein [Streptomyces sp. A1136]